MLAKGPLPHLLFFYGPVVALLWNDRKLALLATRDHFISYSHHVWNVRRLGAAGAFALGFGPRRAGLVAAIYRPGFPAADFRFLSWIMNIPRGLVYLLPWLPLALLQFDEPVELRRRHFALLLGIAVPFVLVELIPGGGPRLAMPARSGPAAWWFGELLAHENLIGRVGFPAGRFLHACVTKSPSSSSESVALRLWLTA